MADTERAERRKVSPSVKEKGRARVEKTIVLNEGNPNGRITRHMELVGLDDAPSIEFRAGDVLFTGGQNSEKEVTHLLQVLGVKPDQVVTFQDKRGGEQKTTALDVVQNKIEVIRATDNFIQLLLERGKEANLAEKDIAMIQRALSDPKLSEEMRNNALADLIEHFHLDNITIQDLMGADVRQDLGAKAYSVASSPLWLPGQVDLTVARVDLESKLGDDVFHRSGVVSGRLDGQETGSEMGIWFTAKSKFNLPDELNKPIVMIGPGTGIAPFRGFIQEIKARGEDHQAVVLYSGGQYNVDRLYKEEFEQAYRDGVLTEEPHYAVSRQVPGQRTYVQDLLKSDQESIRRLVDQGAIFYICGAKQMGEDVIKALKEIAPQLDTNDKERVREDLY